MRRHPGEGRPGPARPARPRWRDPRRWLLLAALAGALAALAGPTRTLPRPAHDLLFVLDVTGSMAVRDQTVDGRPASRLEAARRRVRGALARLPCGSRAGLGVFTERRSFLLFEPVETCANFPALDGAVAALDARMAWEGDSHVARGLHRAIALADGVGADLVFVTDGHEAPPLPGGRAPAFEGEAGRVRGLVVGVGGPVPVPIPRFDDQGRETGAYAMADVPQENRSGPPPADAQSRPGWHPRYAPFGADAAGGTEHLSSLRDAHLRGLAEAAGLGYAPPGDAAALVDALAAAARVRTVDATVDLSPWPAALALAALAALYAAPLAARLAAPRVARRLARPAAPPGPVPAPAHAAALPAARPRMPMTRTAAALAPLAALGATLIAPPAAAHGPTPQKIEETIAIAAPPERVWALVGPFGGIAGWHPLVARAEATGGDGPGAERVLTLRAGEAVPGGEIAEGLDDHEPAQRRYGYRLARENVQALPVSFYSATIEVRPAGEGRSEVAWTGRYYRGDTGNFPAEGQDDETAGKAMATFLRTGLEGLRARAEAR